MRSLSLALFGAFVASAAHAQQPRPPIHPLGQIFATSAASPHPYADKVPFERGRGVSLASR